MRLFAFLLGLAAAVTADQYTGGTPENYKCPTAKVISAGKKKGNKAEFYIDDVKVEGSSGKGINVVVIDPVTQEQEYTVYDVEGDEKRNVALTDYLNGLSYGSIVMAAVMDSGAEKLSDDARAALENCGATIEVPTGGRKVGSHWAFIGSKGMKSGTGVSEWDERDAPAVEIEGKIACWPAGRSQCHIAKVVSQGYKSDDDKGKTEFFIDGSEVQAGKFGRGFNIVTIDPQTMAQSFATFDTNKFFGGESKKMVEYIRGLKMGTIVMIGVKDDGKFDLSGEARDALKWCGGHEGAAELGYREGYALVGYVGAGEGNGKEVYGEREAVAEGRMNCWWADRCPVATVQSAGGENTVPLGGSFAAAVNGVRDPNVVWGRGVNILTLKPDGSHYSFEAFDTWQVLGGAHARNKMIKHIEDIPWGYTVLAGTGDSANTHMNTEAYDAFKMIGGLGSDGPNFDYRASWALVGYKGQQSGEAYEFYEDDSDKQVDITAPVYCSGCPLCRVESAGKWDGDYAKFSIAEVGEEFTPLPFENAERGVNMVVLDMNGKQQVDGYTRNFDTWYVGGAANALVEFINDDISWGQTVLLGLRDSAELQMSDEGYEALTELGHEGEKWTGRNNHGMVGMKGLLRDHATEYTKEDGGRLFNKGNAVTVIAPSYCNEAKYVFLPGSSKKGCSNWNSLWNKQFTPYTDESSRVYSDLFKNPGECAAACQRSAGCDMFEQGEDNVGDYCILGKGDCEFKASDESKGQFKMYAPSDVPKYSRKKGSYQKGCVGNDASGLARVYDASYGPGNEDRCAVLCQLTSGCRAFEVGQDNTNRFCTVWQKTCKFGRGKNTDIHYQYDMELPNLRAGEECTDKRECEEGLMCEEGSCQSSEPASSEPSSAPTPAPTTVEPTGAPIVTSDPTASPIVNDEPTASPTYADNCGDGFGKLKMKNKKANYKKSKSMKGAKTTCECEAYCDSLDDGYPMWVLSLKGGKCTCHIGAEPKVKKDKKKKTKYEDGQD